MPLRTKIAALFAGLTAASALACEPNRGPAEQAALGWKPPLICFESRAYGDGGTVAIGLRDGDGQDTLVVCTQNAWEDSLIPWNTLLVGA